MSNTTTSSVCSRLRCIFNTPRPTTTTTTTTTTGTTTVIAGVKSLCRQINKERNLNRLVELFKKSSQNDHFRTKSSFYETTVRRLAAVKRFSLIDEILEDQKKYEDMSKEGFNTRLIWLYGKSGMFHNAHKVFDEMPKRNCQRTVLSFNALLSACVNSKKFDKVDGLFREIPEKLGIQPDLISYNTVIHAFCEMGSLDSVDLLLDEMEKKGFEPDLITFNTILDGFYANGRFLDGERIWGQMVEKNVIPDVRSYTARMLGFGLEKRTKDAVELFEEMTNKGIKPDVHSFNALITGSVNEENLEAAKLWYSEMKNNGCRPDNSTFKTLIPFACEKGDFSFAFDLSKDVFYRRRLVDAALLQRVVDGLVKELKIENAEELVQRGNKNGYYRYKLKLPSE